MRTGISFTVSPTDRQRLMAIVKGDLLANDDKSGLAHLLHEWEARSVTATKIQAIWEWTPFPLEVQAQRESMPSDAPLKIF